MGSSDVSNELRVFETSGTTYPVTQCNLIGAGIFSTVTRTSNLALTRFLGFRPLDLLIIVA